MSLLKQEPSESTDANDHLEEADHDDQSELDVEVASEEEVTELIEEFEAIKKKLKRLRFIPPLLHIFYRQEKLRSFHVLKK